MHSWELLARALGAGIWGTRINGSLDRAGTHIDDVCVPVIHHINRSSMGSLVASDLHAHLLITYLTPGITAWDLTKLGK